VKFPGSNVMWPALKCISIRKTHTVDLGWVNISSVISGVSGTKCTCPISNIFTRSKDIRQRT